MSEPGARRGWRRHFFYRSERTRTTWKLRLGALGLAAGLLWLGRGWWTEAIARSLVCEPSLVASDAILIENLEPDYLLFERARQLRRAGMAPRVLVPITLDRNGRELNDVAQGVAEVMVRISGVGDVEFVPMRQMEPITLNAARDVREFLENQRIRSVIVVTPLFRSRRSALVYAATLGRGGIAVHCAPVQGSRGVKNWTASWHGIQEVVQQCVKLLYYRLVVLPHDAVLRSPGRAGQSARASPPPGSSGSPPGAWQVPSS